MNIPDSDIRELCSQWWSVLQSIDYPSSGTALRVLNGLVDAYITGRGCGPFGLRGVVRHEKQAAALASHVLFNATKRYEELAQLEGGIQSYLEEVLHGGLTDAGRPVGGLTNG